MAGGEILFGRESIALYCVCTEAEGQGLDNNTGTHTTTDMSSTACVYSDSKPRFGDQRVVEMSEFSQTIARAIKLVSAQFCERLDLEFKCC